MTASRGALIVLAVAFLIGLMTPRAVPVQLHGTVDLVVIPAHETIREFDPLFLKVVLRNNTSEYLLFDRPFQHKHFGFNLIIRHEETGRTLPADGGMRGCICTVYLSKYPLRAATNVASYEVLFRGTDQPIFSLPGSYEIKAFLSAKGKMVASKVVRIHVLPIPEAERIILQEESLIPIGPRHKSNAAYRALGFMEPVNTALMLRLAGHDEELLRLKSVESRLSDSVAKHTLRWKLAVDAIARATAAEERRKAREVFEELRSTMDRVTREVADLALVSQYRELRDYEEAAKLLPRIVERSHFGDSLKYDVEGGWKWEQSVRAFFPEDRRLSCQTRTMHLLGEALVPHALVGSGIGNLTGGTTGWRGPVIGVHLLSAGPVTRMRSISIHETTGEVIDELSRQSGVPLSAPESVRRQPNQANVADLRNWMVLLAWRHKGTWGRQGDGYVLSVTE